MHTLRIQRSGLHLAAWLLFLSLPVIFIEHEGPAEQQQLLLTPSYWLFVAVFAGLFYISFYYLVPEFYLKQRYKAFCGFRHPGYFSFWQSQATFMYITTIRLTSPKWVIVTLIPVQHPALYGYQKFPIAITNWRNRLFQILPKGYAPAPQLKFAFGQFDGRAEWEYLRSEEIAFFAFVLDGAFKIQGPLLHPRDGLLLSGIESIEIEALSNNATLIIIES